MPEEQNYKNHARLDPPMHLFVFPVAIFNVIAAIAATIHDWPDHRYLHLWWIIVSLAFLVLAFKCRVNDLKLQDRIIRLEERLRLAALLPAADQSRINQLTTRHLIALRFASDAELPTLVEKCLAQNLDPKAIKQTIATWRGDYHRV